MDTDYDHPESLYVTLGVPTDASSEVIRNKAKCLSVKNHPDRGGDLSTFRRIIYAKSILTDNALRREYDTYGAVTDATEIIPGVLWLGSLQAANEPEALIKRGINHVLTIIDENDSMGGVYHDPKGRIQYHRLHAVDDESQKLPLDKALPLIRDSALSGDMMLVHCRAGASRSASLVLAHLVAHCGLCLPHALALVRALRPIVAPNDGFLLQLIDFAALNGKPIEVRPMLDPSQRDSAVLEVLHTETRVAADSLGGKEAVTLKVLDLVEAQDISQIQSCLWCSGENTTNTNSHSSK